MKILIMLKNPKLALIIISLIKVTINNNCLKKCSKKIEEFCKNGLKFKNKCIAICNGYKNAKPCLKILELKKKTSCICKDIYDPVCYKGKKYNNSCLAECKGIFYYKKCKVNKFPFYNEDTYFKYYT